MRRLVLVVAVVALAGGCTNTAAKLAAAKSACEAKYGAGKCEQKFGTWVPGPAAFPVETIGPMPTITDPAFSAPPAPTVQPVSGGTAVQTAAPAALSMVWESDNEHPRFDDFTAHGKFEVHWQYWMLRDPRRYSIPPSCRFDWTAQGHRYETRGQGGKGVQPFTGTGQFSITDISNRCFYGSESEASGWDIKVYA